MGEVNNPKIGEYSGKPLITFALFAYNQEKYIRDAIEGVFAQDYSPLEIILSDDCSEDRTFEIIQEMAEAYSGPNVVKVNKNNVNLGLIGHVNKIFELAVGGLIVVAAGDDISMPSRTRRLVEAYERMDRKPLLIHSSVIKIDECTNDLGVEYPPVITEKMDLETIAESCKLYIGATGAWSKDLYTIFGPIQLDKAYEDLVLGFRAALSNSLLYVNEPLVKYRVGSGISTRESGADVGLVKLLKNIQRLNIVAVDVYRQRILDAAKINELIDSNIPKILEDSLSYELARRQVYYSPLRVLIDLFGSRRATIVRAIRSEARLFYLFIKTKL